MNDQKMDNLLNLALDATLQEREKSRTLDVGYNASEKTWEVIVKYHGPAEGLRSEGISVVPLLGGYAVVTLPESALEAFAESPQVEYVEMPKRLYFETFQGKEASCIRSVQTGVDGLTGKGILTGMVDSGVDYRHPAFRNADGTTRILRLWDQSVPGAPPEGYGMGTEYTKEMIDEALALPETEGRRLVPATDVSGHGTAVLGIAAGSGRDERPGVRNRAAMGDFIGEGGADISVRNRAAGENFTDESGEGADAGERQAVLRRGVAYESDLMVVKMGISRENSFPRTTELIQGIDYLVRQAQALGRPMALNLSFGNNYGSQEPYP